MSGTPTTWTTHRARLARAVQRGDDETAETARRDLKATRLEDHIRRVVDTAPPLTAEQRDRLALLLRGPAGGGVNAA